MGAAWGLSIPLTKNTVSTGYGQFGLIFWQFVIAVIVLGIVLFLRRKRPIFERKTIFLFIVLALLGTIHPNSASYVATYYTPASNMAISMATVPRFSFPIAM
jgi:EamA-like transporter family.